MGSSPATGPTPNKGYEAAGLQRLGLVIKQLEALVPMLGSGSEPGAAVLKALNSLAKFVPSGSVTPGAERTNIDRMAMQNAQNNRAMQQMRQGGGQPGGAPQMQPPKAA
jgi:hypothetical protein